MAGKVLTKERSTMSPLLFEMIMYLKYNRDLWGLVDVVEANKRRKGESTSAKARKEAHRERVVATRADIESYDNDQGGSVMLLRNVLEGSVLLFCELIS
mmetsp:Transcript_32162/g.68480  ORF Transcript_32162/g.68480 Transcript_32162/m.68480 type:complete len:99 (-) Transcript_32162:33-329(-)